MSESSWIPTPPADTLTTVQKAVAGYVLMPTDDEVLETALMGIRRGVDRLNTRTWNWNLAYTTITFVAGTQEYSLPTGFKAPRNFSVRDANGFDQMRLQYLPLASFLKEMQATTNASLGTDPSFYTGTNVNLTGLIRLDVAPTAQWISLYPTARLWYFQRVNYPTTEGDSLGVPSEVVPFLQGFAEGFTADRYAPQKASAAYGRAEKALHECIVDDCHGQQADWET